MKQQGSCSVLVITLISLPHHHEHIRSVDFVRHAGLQAQGGEELKSLFAKAPTSLVS